MSGLFQKRARKSAQKKSFRSRPADDDPDDVCDREDSNSDVDSLSSLETTREVQKLRQRQGGLNHWELGTGAKVSKVEELVAGDADPFKLKTGGLLDLKKAKAAKALEEGGNVDPFEREGLKETLVGTQFSKETSLRDEDEEMRKFIEAEMERRRGKSAQQQPGSAGQGSYLTPAEKALKDLPDHLRKSTFKKNEEMLSSQMLTGIPEMDLGIEEKIRNIEATERAKRKLADQDKKQSKPSDSVPTNIAVNFKQPNRFKPQIDEDIKRMRYDSNSATSSALPTHRTVKVGELPEETVIQNVGDGSGLSDRAQDKATDDLHLTKFKQHFHRK